MKKVIKFFTFVFFVCLIVGGFFTCKILKYMEKVYNEGIDLSSIEINNLPHIYDRYGNEVYAVYDNKLMNYVDLNDLHSYTYNAFIAIEDKRFFSHHGVDVKRLSSAIAHYIFKTDDFGGSTITQQLVKNITGDNEIAPERKIREIARAVYLEDHMSKKEILENYLNYIYFGQGAYGIDSASRTFFSKGSYDLSIAESAVLAAMPYAPEGNNPYKDIDARERLLKRQKVILGLMFEQEMISRYEYDEALNEEIVFSYSNDIPVMQYIRLAIEEATEKLTGYTSLSAEKIEQNILKGDIEIYTNIDVDFQNYLYYTAKNFFGNDDIEASTVVSTKSGDIIGVLSSRTNSQYNRATDMLRQPGSSFKPLAVYGPAFDMGILTPDSIVVDEAIYIDYGNGNKWYPNNWYGDFLGECDVYYALAQSINTIAVKELAEVGIDNAMWYLNKFGITSLTDDDYVYPLAIGGITNGVSPFEMTRAYNVFNNNGVYTDISFIDKVFVNGEEVVFEKEQYNLMYEESNNMINDCLRYNVISGSAGNTDINGINVRAKTGTTDDVKDYWLVGYTDDVTAALWVGYDTPRTIGYSSSDVCTLWRNLIIGYYN